MTGYSARCVKNRLLLRSPDTMLVSIPVSWYPSILGCQNGITGNLSTYLSQCVRPVKEVHLRRCIFWSDTIQAVIALFIFMWKDFMG